MMHVFAFFSHGRASLEAEIQEGVEGAVHQIGGAQRPAAVSSADRFQQRTGRAARRGCFPDSCRTIAAGRGVAPTAAISEHDGIAVADSSGTAHSGQAAARPRPKRAAIVPERVRHAGSVEEHEADDDEQQDIQVLEDAGFRQRPGRTSSFSAVSKHGKEQPPQHKRSMPRRATGPSAAQTMKMFRQPPGSGTRGCRPAGYRRSPGTSCRG